MRTYVVALFVLLVAGCTSPSGGDAIDESDECSADIREEARPEVRPLGTFDHYLTNELGFAVTITVQHMHATGCTLRSTTAELADGERFTIEYEDYLWDTQTRFVRYLEVEATDPADWGCAWHYGVTESGLVDRDEHKLCA